MTHTFKAFTICSLLFLSGACQIDAPKNEETQAEQSGKLKLNDMYDYEQKMLEIDGRLEEYTKANSLKYTRNDDSQEGVVAYLDNADNIIQNKRELLRC